MIAAIGLFICLSALIAWCYFQWMFRPYRLDLFRHRMFMVRDRLFDEAAKGRLDFGSAVYRQTRELLNTYIRFAHRFSTSYLLAAIFSPPPVPQTLGDGIFKFINEINELPPESRDLVVKTLVNAHRELMSYCMATSLTLRLIWCIVIRAFPEIAFAYQFNQRTSEHRFFFRPPAA